jgi:hypothetical protein
MKAKGLLLVVVLAAAIIYVAWFANPGKKSALETVVEKGLQAEVDLTNVNLQTLRGFIVSYIAGEGTTPKSLQDVRSTGLLVAGATDAWGHSIRYERVSDSSFRLISAGRDGRFATRDDIVLEY